MLSFKDFMTVDYTPGEPEHWSLECAQTRHVVASVKKPKPQMKH